jgi:RNA polymerase sigma factor (sigma-70 family)
MQIKDLSDSQLIESIREDAGSTCSVNKSLEELIDRHSGIFLDIVNSYVPEASFFVKKNDIVEEKNFYIYQAALKYDPNRGTKFSTYLGNETKWMCLNLYNKNKRHPEIACEDQIIESNFSKHYLNDEIDRDSFDKIIELSKKDPDPRVYKIFQMRYVVGEKNKVMPWKKISEELNMSIQGCINIHNSCIKKFKNKLNKE